MNLLIFIKSNTRIIIFFTIVMSTVNFILLLNTNRGTHLNDVLYLDFLLLLFSFIYAISSYLTWYNKYKFIREALDNNKSIDFTIPEDKTFFTFLLKEIISNKNSESDRYRYELKQSIDELNDYITKWVHEIKIPVSVCELILERIEDFVLVNEIHTELENIKFLTNQVLYISRASDYHEDLFTRNFCLDKTVKESIKRNSTLLISKNIELIIANLNFDILSDEKWISYILDQIFHNAYKYLNQDGIIKIGASFDEDNNVNLYIRDNGVGILPKDIPRIFDKSFTGNNKSHLSKSTGMGLYITKKMLDRLGHKIEVSSEPNNFTEFIITFYRISDYMSNITKL